MINKDVLPNVMTLVGFVAAALFVAFGFFIILSPSMMQIPKEFRVIFAITVIGYGIFRSVIIYQKSKQRKESDDETEF